MGEEQKEVFEALKYTGEEEVYEQLEDDFVKLANADEEIIQEEKDKKLLKRKSVSFASEVLVKEEEKEHPVMFDFTEIKKELEEEEKLKKEQEKI